MVRLGSRHLYLLSVLTALSLLLKNVEGAIFVALLGLQSLILLKLSVLEFFPKLFCSVAFFSS